MDNQFAPVPGRGPRDPRYTQLPSPVEPGAEGYYAPQGQVVAEHGHEGLKNIISTVLIILCAPIVALLLITFVFQSYEVDGPSMESTLQHGDRLIVVKAARTLASITNEPYMPERGEIIIFTKPGFMDYGHSSEKQLIKRAIALPGERVVVHNDRLTVYNDEFPQGFSPDKAGGYNLLSETTPGEVDLVVPKNEIFVVGDNRQNSLDSRYFGPISTDDIVGTLALRIYPIDKTEKF